MPDTRVKYVPAADGASLAYAKSGTGPTVLCLLPNPVSHLALAPEVPTFGRLFARLEREFSLVRVDYRGFGLSGGRGAVTLEHASADLLLVLEHLRLRDVALFAWGFGAMHALTFAARAPHMVRAVVLAQPSVPWLGAELNLRVRDLRNVSDTAQNRVRGSLMAGGRAEDASAVERLIPAAMSAEALSAWRHLFAPESTASVSEALPALEAPVLILHASGDELFPLDGARHLAAKLPHAELRLCDDDFALAPLADEELVEGAIEFLRVRVPDSPAAGVAANLSARELEVLRLLAGGKTNHQIAGALVISPSTVSHHLGHIFAKLEVANRTEAVAFAHRENLL